MEWSERMGEGRQELEVMEGEIAGKTKLEARKYSREFANQPAARNVTHLTKARGI